jgi:biopolymer transport protein ExbD
MSMGAGGPPGPTGTPPTPSGAHPQGSVVRFKSELRRAIRRNAHEPEVNFLNITAMLDIMTIILVFLLKTLGESSAAVPQSDDMKLPASVVKTQPHQEGVVVTISKSQILVGDNKIMSLPGRESTAQTGVGAQYKRSGPNDLYIVPLGNSLQAARKTDKAIRQAKGLDPSTSEAIIIADKGTPYRLLIEVLFTLGQSEFGKYHLMVLQSKKRAD